MVIGYAGDPILLECDSINDNIISTEQVTWQ